MNLLCAGESLGIAWLDEQLAYQIGLCAVLYSTGLLADWDVYIVVVSQIITGQSTQKSVCIPQKLF